MHPRKFVIIILLLVFSLGLSTNPTLDNFIFHNGYFYAYAKNRYEIVKLDTAGHQVASIGRRGRGPAEFSAPFVSMTFGGDTLFVYDGINKRLTLLDENLQSIKERFPKVFINYIIYLYNRLYSNSIDLGPAVPKNKRSIEQILRRERNSDFKIRSLGEPYKLLTTYHNKIINPLYSHQKVKSNGDTFVIFYPNQNKIKFYKNNSLQTIKLSSIESLSLGKKTHYKVHAMKAIFKTYPYFPVYYRLIQNILLTHHHSILIQIKSYKKGAQILFYDLNKRKVTKSIPSPEGKIIGIDSTYFYFYKDKSFKKYSLSELTSCSNNHLTFYMGSFREQSELDKRSFRKIYNWVRHGNIPYNFILKNNHWFSSVDKDDYRTAVNYMHMWDVWGPLRFEGDCKACFKNGIHVRINGGPLQALPVPVKELQSTVSCKQ